MAKKGSPEDANPRSERSAAPFVPKTTSIRTLSAAAHECRGCDLYKTATQIVVTVRLYSGLTESARMYTSRFRPSIVPVIRTG